jgi:hypothetical protein
MLNTAPQAAPEASETPRANPLRVLEFATRGWRFIDECRA